MPPGACSRKNLPSTYSCGVSSLAWNLARMSSFFPAGIFAPRPTILFTRMNGMRAKLISPSASSVPPRNARRKNCRRLMRLSSPPAWIEVSSCGLIMALLDRRRQVPRCVEVHAGTAHRGADEGEHEERTDPRGPHRDHHVARRAVEHALHDEHEECGERDHRRDRDEVV